MKLYAIVEINDDMYDNFNEWYITTGGDLSVGYVKDDIYVRYKRIEDDMLKLKPLPMEAVNLEEVLHDDGLYYVEKIAPTDFDRGFNYCLEKILGEKIDE